MLADICCCLATMSAALGHRSHFAIVKVYECSCFIFSNRHCGGESEMLAVDINPERDETLMETA